MSSRFIMPFADVGSGIKPSSGAKLFFFELDGVTPKDTDSDQTATPDQNANPVIANSNGVFGDIYITGQYKVTLTDKNGSQIFGLAIVSEIITLASALTTFSLIEIVSIDVLPAVIVGENNTVTGYYNSTTVGGGDFLGVAAARHNGGTNIDPDRASEFGTAAYFVNSGSDAACHVRLFEGKAFGEFFGALGDGTTDDYPSIQALADSDFKDIGLGEGNFVLSAGVSISDKSFIGSGMRNTTLKPSANTFDALTLIDGSDFFTLSDFAIIHSSLGTGNGVVIENNCHNFTCDRIETTMSSTGLLIGAATFAMNLDQIRFNSGTNGFEIAGGGNATTLQIGTMYTNDCSNIGFNFNCHDVIADNLIVDIAGSYPVFATSVTSLIINNLHMESGDFGSSSERAYVRVNGCKNVHLNNIFADGMDSSVPHYAVSVMDGPTKLWVKGVRMINGTNDNLALINEGGSGRTENSYSFRGVDVTDASVVTTGGTVTGRFEFPEYQDFYFSDTTDSNGKITVTHPDVPSILGSNPMAYFASALDNGANSGTEIITFTGSTQVQLRSLATGGAIATSGIVITLHLRFQR